MPYECVPHTSFQFCAIGVEVAGMEANLPAFEDNSL